MVRRLLQALLPTDADFNAFCVDYFDRVSQRFAAGMDRLEKANLLLKLATPTELVAALRQHFQKDSSALSTIDQLLAQPRSDAERKARHLWSKLESLYLDREERLQAGQATLEVDKQIVRLKREQRQGSQLAEGEVLGDRYRLIEVIGSGGFAKVWKAFDRRNNRSVAVKILHGDQGSEGSRVERFERGAREMLQLEHPHIVRVLDGPAEHNGFHYFVMELMAGGDLFRAVTKNKIDRMAALSALLQVGQALSYAHSRGIVHRDIKPQNILLDGHGMARLTDFDLVWAADTTGGTRTGAMGTFLFSAPEEMADASRIDQRADVYALGMTTVFVVLGRNLSRDVLDRRLLVIDQLDCPEPVRVLLRQTTAPDPEDRPRTADEFCARLAAALNPLSIDRSASVTLPSVRPVGTSSAFTPVRRGLIGAGVVLLVAALIVGIYALQQAEPRPWITKPPPPARHEPAPDYSAAQQAIRQNLERRQFAAAIQQADLLLRDGTLPSGERATVTYFKTQAIREIQNQLSYESFAAAAVGGEYEQALAAYHDLPKDSVFYPMTRGAYNQIFPIYADIHLRKAESFRQLGKCADFERELQAVLRIEPTHARSVAIRQRPCPDKPAADPAGGSRVNPPEKQEALRLRQVEAALDRAESDLFAHNYQAARDAALAGRTLSPERSWRILGTIACIGRDEPGVLSAYGQLSSSGREYLRSICSLHGQQKLSDELANADSILSQAQTEYVNGNYNKAIDRAKLAIKNSPIRAYRIMGSSACSKKDLKGVREAYAHVDGAGRNYLIYVCQRNGIQLVGNTFKLDAAPTAAPEPGDKPSDGAVP